MGKQHEDDDEEITLTRGELRQAIERSKAEASMSDDEKRVRQIVRDEMEGVLGSFFSFEDDDAASDKRKQKPKGAGSGILGIFSGEAS